MKTFRLLFALLIVASANAYGQDAANGLPREVNAFLSQRFPDWKSADARPDFIAGDFDGNGQTDYAVYIKRGKPAKRKLSVTALLRKGGKFRPYILESENAAADESEKYGSYLAYNKKGAKGYNHETQKAFTFAHDAVFVGFWEKGGSSYIYRNGRFRAIITSD
jgi:hypothetical protein